MDLTSKHTMANIMAETLSNVRLYKQFFYVLKKKITMDVTITIRYILYLTLAVSLSFYVLLAHPVIIKLTRRRDRGFGLSIRGVWIRGEGMKGLFFV